MIDRFDITAYVIDGVLILVPNSASPDGSVVFEIPPELCGVVAPDEEVGAAILKAAQRCREGNGLVGVNSDSVAKSLGFKSNADIRKRLVPIIVSRRGGGTILSIAPMRRERSQVVFTEEEFEAPISDLAMIGRLTKVAAKISGK